MGKQSEIFSELTEIFGDIFNPVYSSLGTYDIIEGNNSYIIELSIPGYKKDQISIDIVNNMLVVTGDNKRIINDTNSTYRKESIHYGKFTRRFTIPENASGDISAKLEDGILKITIPKSEKTRSKIRID